MISETEKINQNTVNIDTANTLDIVKMINEEDMKVAIAVQKCLPEIAKATDIITENFAKGGRLLYFGAGTSGRLGVLDASECPPTFSVPETMVCGIIAGGDYALRHAVEGAEDKQDEALKDFSTACVSENDTVVVISASGNAAYIIEILKLAKEKKIASIAITSNINALSKMYADIFICAETGPEVISGSTRMKAGTAQKLILNMLTTASMIKSGKVYKNYMIDVRPTNEKLKNRAVSLVAEIADTTKELALQTLKSNGFKVKPAILSLKYGFSNDVAETKLASENGILKKVFENQSSSR